MSQLLVPESYIEGWYLKLRTASVPPRLFAFIPFYFVSASPGESCSGVMLLDGQTQRSHLYRLPLSAFSSSPLPSAAQSLSWLTTASRQEPVDKSPFAFFELRVGRNASLSPSALEASLRPLNSSEASSSVDIAIRLTPSAASLAAFAASRSAFASVFSPSSHTVGLFAFLPLACYQQVVDMELEVSGSLLLDGQSIELQQATAYLEKTRGLSFPDQYVWMAASHFTALQPQQQQTEAAPSSLFFSVASVPILPTALHLPGFVSTVLLNASALHFATQLGSVLTVMQVTRTDISIVVYDRSFSLRLAMHVQRGEATEAVAAGEERPGFLWAARDGVLKRAIHQQLGRDSLTVSLHEVRRMKEGEAEEGEEAQHTVVAAEAAEWRSRGLALRPVFVSRSESAGLEVFVQDAALFERQLQELYREVRPWSRDAYCSIHTPVFSFPLSAAFVLSLMPAQLAAAITAVGGLSVTLTALLSCCLASVIASLCCMQRGDKRWHRVEK